MADGYALRFDGVEYTAEMERLMASVLGMPASATRARPGVRIGGGLEVTVGAGPESAVVAPGAGIITDTGAGAGSWLFVIPSSVSKPLATRPSAGQTRLDEVVAKINTSTDEVEIEVLTGSATAGTPAPPTIAAGKLFLKEFLVPESPTAITLQKTAPRTAALGGILPVADDDERDAIEVLYDGLVVYREDLELWEGRAGGAWGEMPQKINQDDAMDTASGNAAPSSTANVTIPGLSVTVTSPGTGAAWMVNLDCDVLIGAAPGGNIVGLLVDGVEHPSLIVSAGPASGRFAASKRYRITGLAAGDHVFTARTRSQGAYTTTVNQTHSTMTVERVA